MEQVKRIDSSAFNRVRACYYKRQLTYQQYKTLRGQVLAGNGDAALKGLRKILRGNRK